MRHLKRVGEGGNDHRDPRADGNHDGGREPRSKRENSINDSIANVVQISKIVFLLYFE